jgi:CubicO group peptidase (beta-lactamase class C family)
MRAFPIGVLSLLALLATARAPAAPPAPTPLPVASPAALGLSGARLEAMADFFRGEVDRHVAAGYVLMVARDGRLAYTATVGERDRERRLPMTLDTRFRVASMTKPVTTVAVLMLYEQGRFLLDDPVAKYLPEFASPVVATGVDAAGAVVTAPAQHPITIRELLTHSAGLGYAFDGATPLGKAWLALPMGTPGTLADKVREIAKLPLYFEPGTGWRYSYADDVLGRLVEVVAGVPFARYLDEHLFQPLGMRHTGFSIPASALPELAVVYRNTPAGGLEASDMSSWSQPADASRWPSGGGGLVSTAGDYLRFAQMLANGGSLDGRQYLSPVTVGLMTSNQVPPDAMQKFWGADSVGLGYGLGVGVVVDAASSPQADLPGDFSWGGILDTHWLVSPASGLVAVLMTQVDPRGRTAPARTDPDFRNLLYAAVERLGPPPPR